ncbi:MAG: 6-hydroxymethylpterin diphosphokinase MptE-like protein, partial [Planctomycetota bacterium]|nr:6-hydroxymethylpterin diphosphokinase MptE-like protein [Planctomycetota bacterium]
MDLKSAAVVVVTGFGLGHHVASLARRMGRDGLIIVFEPDTGLLRATLERIDHSEWMRGSNVLFMTNPDDAASITSSLEGAEGLLAIGTKILSHPPSAARLGESANRFCDAFTRVVAATRTVVVTAMVQSEVTIRNLLMNLDSYCRAADDPGAGGADLDGLCAGRPAIVVSAGPSLHRNIELLATTPGLRERCVIIAVQTTLKTLLTRGIRPHFVTALDHHEISRRFYEGLTEEDVEGVCLIAEPKANPAILEAFPGDVRCVRDETADLIAGEALAGLHATIKPGATVAHLAYFLARHLGCDPVILIGQDLGFTDGQYYARGAAIHDVWSSELNPFNTLETMEWQRIVRGRPTLRKGVDHLGRPIYSDEQMHSYLAHFEREFLRDAAQGLRIIDATEGGVAKANTTPMTLREALAQFAPSNGPPLPEFKSAKRLLDPRTKQRLEERLRNVRGDIGRIERRSRDTERLLQKMMRVHPDQKALGRLIDQVDRIRDEVHSLSDAFGLVHRLNQTGGFRRVRTDRAMRLDESLDPIAKQKRQIERDLENVRWLADAAESLASTFDDAIASLNGAPKRTRDPAPRDVDEGSSNRRGRKAVAVAVMPVDTRAEPGDIGSGWSELILGTPAIRLTLARLARCEGLSTIAIVTDDEARVREVIGEAPKGLRIECIEVERQLITRGRASVRAARALAASCWRGAIGNLTCYDEALTEATGAALERLHADGALLVGPDWALVDPSICDAVIERWRESPERRRLVFTQAPPGIAGAVIGRELAAEFTTGRERSGVFATIGAAVGYVPVRPVADPIAQPVCVHVAPELRDLGGRLIADAPHRVAWMETAIGAAGCRTSNDAIALDQGSLLEALVATGRERPPALEHLIIDPGGMRALGGLRGDWFGLVEASTQIDESMLRSIVEQAAAMNPLVGITIGGPGTGLGDLLEHDDPARLILMARECGARAIHVRTDLLAAADRV